MIDHISDQLEADKTVSIGMASGLASTEQENSVAAVFSREIQVLDVLDFNLFFGEEAQHDLNGNVIITYYLEDAPDNAALNVCYIDANGAAQTVPAVYANSKLTFSTDHFSSYAIVAVKNPVYYPSYYTLNFETNGGTEIKPLSKIEYSMVALSEYEPVREGYIFMGWFADAGLAEELDTIRLDRNKTVYAKWNSAFSDVDNDAYYHNAVIWAIKKSITDGTSDTTFGPNDTCTRAELVTFLWRAAGSPQTADKINPFIDVAEDAYYYNAVLWAIEKGVTEGTNRNTFSPDDSCTRGQMAMFLYRAVGSPIASGDSPFTDLDEEAYYHNAVLWAVRNGITEGTSATAFSPDASCTRAQIVTFLYRCDTK